MQNKAIIWSKSVFYKNNMSTIWTLVLKRSLNSLNYIILIKLIRSTLFQTTLYFKYFVRHSKNQLIDFIETVLIDIMKYYAVISSYNVCPFRQTFHYYLKPRNKIFKTKTFLNEIIRSDTLKTVWGCSRGLQSKQGYI